MGYALGVPCYGLQGFPVHVKNASRKPLIVSMGTVGLRVSLLASGFDCLIIYVV